MWNDYREQSKLEWGREVPGSSPLTLEEIKLGVLLRIADSLENMEQSYKDLFGYYKEFEQKNKKLKKTIAGLKGYINKIKK